MARSQSASLNFAFFTHLLDFYQQNRGRIRQNYRDLSKKFLDYNDPSNAQAYLRQPQFEALEIYIFLKEYLNNEPVHQIFRDWSDATGRFEGRTPVDASTSKRQLALFDQPTQEQFDDVYSHMQSFARPYPNYIFALTMGTGKTILMATCIFYEFILANKWPQDSKYCHNALVFAPDTTVLQSLREIQTFDKSLVVPPEYVNWLDTNLRFHFLDEAGMALSVLDHSRFNIIISNTQKIILKRQHQEKSPMEQLLGSGKPTYDPGSVYEEYGELYGWTEPEAEEELTTNQRFEKLRRLERLGIYVDEAHHAFGNPLARDMGLQMTKTSLRLTIDILAGELEKRGTKVVACYNYTGTPYVKDQILPEVVYAFGLQDAINKDYLKKVRIHGYTNPKTTEFVDIAINDFLAHNDLDDRHEGLRPKLAFFAATIDELQNELRPAVENALSRHGIPTSKILVNVGDEKLTTSDDIREFNRLDTPGSDKQFILLVNKGREGWNCRSLFGVALYRKPKSKIFVLQASMRCLRSIGDVQQTGRVYLSDENIQILEDELQQNFRVSIEEMQNSGDNREIVRIRVKEPVEKIKLVRVHRLFKLKPRTPEPGFSLQLDEAPTEQYRLIHTERDGLTTDSRAILEEDISYLREQRQFGAITLVAEIARYLNMSCLEIEDILANTAEGISAILASVNEFNEVLYDWVIPRLFEALYEIREHEDTEPYEVELVKIPPDGYYQVSAKEEMIVRESDAGQHASKSFHLDTYCFDSGPERQLFWSLLRDGRIEKLYFTGMLTHGQSEFFVQYIDPESHAIRSYYPDFLFQTVDGNFVIVEVKGDNKIDDPIVRAKQEFAQQTARASGMSYGIIKGSDANMGHYETLLVPRNAAFEQGQLPSEFQ